MVVGGIVVEVVGLVAVGGISVVVACVVDSCPEVAVARSIGGVAQLVVMSGVGGVTGVLGWEW